MVEPKLQMGLTAGPFEYLLKHKLNMDIRLDEPSWAELQVGDVIEFLEDPGEQRSIRVEIIDRLHYPTFRALFADYPPDVPLVGSVEDNVQQMYRWWTREEEQQWGVLGLKVRLLEAD